MKMSNFTTGNNKVCEQRAKSIIGQLKIMDLSSPFLNDQVFLVCEMVGQQKRDVIDGLSGDP